VQKKSPLIRKRDRYAGVGKKEENMDFNERLAPELRSSVSLLPDGLAKGFTPETIATTRIQVPPISDPQVEVSNQLIPGSDGVTKVKVRIYKPRNLPGPHSGILYLHGGGYATGSPELFDFICNDLVKEVGSVIISPDYRLAPENPYPAGLDDCYAALTWFAANAPSLDVDPERIAVTGASSGGGHTIAVALLSRDRCGPKICFQMPLYPTMDDRLLTPSSQAIQDGRVLNLETCENIWRMYLGAEHKNMDIPIYASPGRATDLKGLPPAYTFVGELDPHRDETINYVTQLLRADVSTGFALYPGCFHGFEIFAPQAKISQLAQQMSILALKEALA
jgi:acetyl esterase/lipase